MRNSACTSRPLVTSSEFEVDNCIHCLYESELELVCATAYIPCIASKSLQWDCAPRVAELCVITLTVW